MGFQAGARLDTADAVTPEHEVAFQFVGGNRELGQGSGPLSGILP